VVLENGKVVEQGNHRELYAQFGRYYLMWQKQTAGI
jgi:ABC-type multidrug transport system fused ATPase/permease subunit